MSAKSKRGSMQGSLDLKGLTQEDDSLTSIGTGHNVFSKASSAHWKKIKYSVVKGAAPVPVTATDDGDEDYESLHKKAQGAFKVLLSSYSTAQQKEKNKKELLNNGLEVNSLAQKRTTLKSLKKVVDFKISQGENYRQLLLFGCLICAYCFMITRLRNVENSFAVETSLQNFLHEPVLTKGSDHLKKTDIYDFIEHIRDAVFKDPVCGDGVCDYPQEFAGFGPFGCARDCGEYQNVSAAFFQGVDGTVPQGQTAAQQPAYIVAAANGALPDYRFNVYLPRMRQFYFEEDQPVEHNEFTQFEVPDDNITVCLFQRNKLYGDEVSVETAAIFLNVDLATVPDDPDVLNYDYGTFGEAIAWNAGVKTQLYVDPSDPRNTTSHPRNPVWDTGLQYGMGWLFGLASETGVEIVKEQPLCSLTQEAIEAAAKTGKCPYQNIIFPLEEKCYDADKLAREWSAGCPACFTYEMRRFTQPGDELPEIRPEAAPQRPVTPGNTLISAMLITQRRKKTELCHPDPRVEGECDKNCNQTLTVLGPLYQDSPCKGDALDDSPYGIDPAFLQSSDLFDGNLRRELAYTSEEISPDSGSPYGFFASKYELGPVADTFAVSNEESNQPLYRLYLDSRMHAPISKKAVQVMVEGGYLTNQTESVTLEFGTFNAKLKHFAWSKVTFSFHDGGLIEADYTVESFAMDDLESDLPELICFCLIALLCVKMWWSEFHELVGQCREDGIMGFFNYFFDLSNLLDVMCIYSVPLSIVFVFASGAMLKEVLDLSSAGDLPRVLVNPEAPMRIFATEKDEEIRFLNIRHMISIFIMIAKTSRSWVGINVLMLTARFFKMLHFQGRMGLVTRTFGNSLVDIAHFTVIFAIVILLYGVMGQFMFGTQMPEFRSIGSSMMMLVSTTLTLGVEDYNRMVGVTPSMDYITTIFWLTFLFLSTVVLLNIFLAILVEGFSVVKETATNSETLIQGYAETWTHDTWELRERLMQSLSCLTRKQRSRFISNTRMQELLNAWLYHINTTLGEEHDDETLGGGKEVERGKSNVIRLLAGEEMTEKDLMNLLLDLIDEAPERVITFKRRAWQLSKALRRASQTASVAPSPEHGSSMDVEQGKGASVDQPKHKEGGFARFRRRSSSFGGSASFWEGLREEIGTNDGRGTG
eukprot:CAMPEP_0169431480 /NCGR_PEP_ID=MMETSP1042-20121227/2974_1 /TAXON_ID=464988 /ORGANISM="Hemiselmis andersenii, Strain CCMP1180" /LENGTH=1151 /DNA_ID=CAMNT_0009541903 /DNA_START=29 /DNA_END=3481 /DNA_ORIENTATION=-